MPKSKTVHEKKESVVLHTKAPAASGKYLREWFMFDAIIGGDWGAMMKPPAVDSCVDPAAAAASAVAVEAAVAPSERS